MKVIQLLNSDGKHSGLYVTERTDAFENIEKDIQDAFKVGKANEVYILDTVDEYLHVKKIKRVFADEVYTDVI